jgi:hypothetical protein
MHILFGISSILYLPKLSAGQAGFWENQKHSQITSISWQKLWILKLKELAERFPIAFPIVYFSSLLDSVFLY